MPNFETADERHRAEAKTSGRTRKARAFRLEPFFEILKKLLRLLGDLRGALVVAAKIRKRSGDRSFWGRGGGRGGLDLGGLFTAKQTLEPI
jgi:hypothetical protein